MKKIENTKQMPVLFIGHGSPMNAIEENQFTEGWKKIAGKLAPDFFHQDKKVFDSQIMFQRKNVYLFGRLEYTKVYTKITKEEFL